MREEARRVARERERGAAMEKALTLEGTTNRDNNTCVRNKNPRVTHG